MHAAIQEQYNRLIVQKVQIYDRTDVNFILDKIFCETSKYHDLSDKQKSAILETILTSVDFITSAMHYSDTLLTIDDEQHRHQTPAFSGLLLRAKDTFKTLQDLAECLNRQTGRTTRLADEYVKLAITNGCTGSLIDHIEVDKFGGLSWWKSMSINLAELVEKKLHAMQPKVNVIISQYDRNHYQIKIR